MFGIDAGSRQRKGSEAVAARQYAQETMDVIAYLRAPLKALPPEIAYVRIASVAMLESLVFFNEVMQKYERWQPLRVPEPELISVARGGSVDPGLFKVLRQWIRALTDPRHHEHWSTHAFNRSDARIEQDYNRAVDRAEAAMTLLSLSEVPNDECVELAQGLRDHPLDMTILEYVRGLVPRRFY